MISHPEQSAATSKDATFWSTLDRLVAESQLVIDRPHGTSHPRYPEFIYPLDYGYLEGTTAADGDGIDVWIGSLPDRALKAIVCTVDLIGRDAEIKLLLGCTREEAQIILATHNSGPQAATLIERGL
ncbi:MAG: inorganic pyrophosphatase [Chloroflexi bacterium]|nr:inorganic pyrophosphatase [Chloroflexota bacterium]